MMDVLNDILDILKLRGVLYFRTDFSPPWAVTVPDFEQAARFHLVVQGQCCVGTPAGKTLTLAPGDLILIPGGRSHILSDEPGRPAPPLEDVLKAAGYQGEGVFAVGEGDTTASTQMVCGHFSFRKGADHAILRNLPDHLLITGAMRAKDPWLDEILRLVTRQVFSDDLGAEATVTRLSEVLFIELLRTGINNCETLQAALQAYRDPHIGKALELIHKETARSWTVDDLAAKVGMSRSRFAERFRELLDMGPISYLSEWRLQRALALLEDSQASIQQVARHTGYQSPAAFTRAFSAKFGVSPRKYRHLSG